MRIIRTWIHKRQTEYTKILYLFAKFHITDCKSYLFSISDSQYNFWRNDTGICKGVSICCNLCIIKDKKIENLDEAVVVYNFAVEDFNTYHVGSLGVWVHNDCSTKQVRTYYADGDMAELKQYEL